MWLRSEWTTFTLRCLSSNSLKMGWRSQQHWLDLDCPEGGYLVNCGYRLNHLPSIRPQWSQAYSGKGLSVLKFYWQKMLLAIFRHITYQVLFISKASLNSLFHRSLTLLSSMISKLSVFSHLSFLFLKLFFLIFPKIFLLYQLE